MFGECHHLYEELSPTKFEAYIKIKVEIPTYIDIWIDYYKIII